VLFVFTAYGASRPTFVSLHLVVLLAASSLLRQLISCGRQACPHPIDGKVFFSPPGGQDASLEIAALEEAHLPSTPLA
jgi:hypothetical protein